MAKKISIIKFEGIVQNGILRIPVMDLFVNDAVARAKKEVFDDLKILINNLGYMENISSSLRKEADEEFERIKEKHLPSSNKTTKKEEKK